MERGDERGETSAVRRLKQLWRLGKIECSGKSDIEKPICVRIRRHLQRLYPLEVSAEPDNPTLNAPNISVRVVRYEDVPNVVVNTSYGGFLVYMWRDLRLHLSNQSVGSLLSKCQSSQATNFTLASKQARID